jgi:HK97 family phage portal protein
LNPFKNIFKKSITYAQTIPLWKDGKPKWNDWRTDRAIKYGYKSSATVYSCINLIAKSASSVPWHVYKKNREGSWEIVEGHPLEILIDKPNAFMSRKDLIERMTTHLYLGGNSILTKNRANNITAELWIMPPDAIQVVPSSRDFISHYEYKADGLQYRLESKDVIHNKFIDPGDMYWGMAPLQAASKQIDTDVSALNWNKVSLQNRGITDGVFSFEQPLTKQQFDEARVMVREQYSGTENGRTPWVMGSGATYTPMALSPAEMDFIESRKFTREEICSIFGVPPVMIGYYENATLANVETGRKIFWQDTLIPYLEDIKNCFNLSLTPEFGNDIELGYDTSNVDALQENMTEKINNAKSLWSMGIPFNNVNQRLELGFDDIEGGEIGYLPTSLLPASMAGETLVAEPQSDPPNNDNEEAKGFIPQTSKSQSKANLKGLNFSIDEHKAYYWKSYERQRSQWYANITLKSSRIYLDMGKAVSKAYKANGKAGVKKSIDSFKPIWKKSIIAWWTEMVKEFGHETYRELKHIKPSESKAIVDEIVDAFNPYARIIASYIEAMATEKIVTIATSRKSEVLNIIKKLEENDVRMSVDEIAKSINNKFEDLSRYSAYRIARTEVVGASNYGSYMGAKSTGLKLAKVWITSRDSRVRDQHEEMDGKQIGMDEQFKMPNGDILTYPGDYTADAPGNTINCRCAIAYEPL